MPQTGITTEVKQPPDLPAYINQKDSLQNRALCSCDINTRAAPRAALVIAASSL